MPELREAVIALLEAAKQHQRYSPAPGAESLLASAEQILAALDPAAIPAAVVMESPAFRRRRPEPDSAA
jgi:hypothetical protein